MSVLKNFVCAVAFGLAIGQSAHSQENSYNVDNHFTQSGPETLLTGELQSLIDLVHEAGGGTIYFPPGKYLTGTLFLKSNVYLEFSPGATLFGSKDMDDYPHTGMKSLLYANAQKNLGIKGKGTVNGNGDAFWRGKERPYIRPDRCILFEHCTDVSISDVHVTNSPNWNIDVRFCERVWITGVTITSEREAPNADGIDPVSSKDVFISNCYIKVGDDAICPKSRGDIPMENLVVTNCILESDDTGIKLGTRSDSDIRNALFSNIVIRNTQYGIGMYAKDGGTFENIRFENIHIETTPYDANKASSPSKNYPLFLDLEKREADSELGKIKNIFFSNITIDTPNGNCLFFGQKDSKIENLNLSGIYYQLHHRQTFEGNSKPRGVRTLRSSASNDFSDVPAHFVFAHIDGLSIDDLSIHDLSKETDHERRMIWGYDIHRVKLSDFENEMALPNKALPQVHLKESSEIEIVSCTPSNTETPFLFLEGAETREVYVYNNNFSYLDAIFGHDELFNINELKEYYNIEPGR